MSITLIMGPMFSGKTSELIRLVDRKRITGKTCLIIKNIKDSRYDTKNITTHSQICYKQCDVIHLIELTHEFIIDIIRLKKYDVVAIDEGHFFPNLEKYCSVLANNQIDVIVSALDGSFEQKIFSEISNLIPNAETIIKLTAICMICKESDASFTIRTIESTEQILVGGFDIYQSVCRKCMNEYKKLKQINSLINS